MPNHPDPSAMQEVMRLAQSETGQQLLALLRAKDGGAVHQAMHHAAAGNYDQVQQTLSTLMRSPDVQALLAQLEGEKHG